MTTAAIKQAREWLQAHPPSGQRAEWLESLVDSGWAAPSWPTEWFGRGLPAEEARTTDAVFRSAKFPVDIDPSDQKANSVLGGDDIQGWGQDVINLWAATVASHAGDDLKREVLRDLLLGRTAMCLLYSEPGAGSDLAGVRTTAIRDGDEWIIQRSKSLDVRRSSSGLCLPHCADRPRSAKTQRPFLFLPADEATWCRGSALASSNG